MIPGQDLPSKFAANYPAICRHFQFSDMHNGSWYLEILPTGDVMLFVVQEVRNGVVVRRSGVPKSFQECRKTFWARTHQMSLEAGHESLPPPLPEIVWK